MHLSSKKGTLAVGRHLAANSFVGQLHRQSTLDSIVAPVSLSARDPVLGPRDKPSLLQSGLS